MSLEYHVLNFTSMSYDAFCTNCPHFAIGCCTFFKEGSCRYKYHKRCDKNFLCDRYDCKYGHGISPEKRILVNNIYDEKYSSSSAFETSENRCKMPMNCIDKDCKKDHHLEYDDRSFIYKIVNSEVTDKEAKVEYAKKYNGLRAASSTNSDMMSEGSTVSIGSPYPFEMPPTPPVMNISFAALFKNESVSEVAGAGDEEYIAEDDLTSMMDEMLTIRKEMASKNKIVNDIKEKIKKMEEELSIAEDDAKIGKMRLKELATKIAGFEE